MSNLELVALVVRDYDAAIHFFVDVLQFELVEDTVADERWPPKALGRRATQWRPNGYSPCTR
jgi:catechol 2,3-dioxygenase-like lactoylglutathione lyase family enzyme